MTQHDPPLRTARVAIGLTGMPGLLNDPRSSPASCTSHLPTDSVIVASDALTTHLGALGGRVGAVVAAGTGVDRPRHRPCRHLESRRRLGPPASATTGSGAWIGAAGLRAALRHADGRDGGSARLDDELRDAVRTTPTTAIARDLQRTSARARARRVRAERRAMPRMPATRWPSTSGTGRAPHWPNRPRPRRAGCRRSSRGEASSSTPARSSRRRSRTHSVDSFPRRGCRPRSARRPTAPSCSPSAAWRARTSSAPRTPSSFRPPQRHAELVAGGGPRLVVRGSSGRARSGRSASAPTLGA